MHYIEIQVKFLSIFDPGKMENLNCFRRYHTQFVCRCERGKLTCVDKSELVAFYFISQHRESCYRYIVFVLGPVDNPKHP